jgi:N-acetylmuramoyl-L-alanine amidase
MTHQDIDILARTLYGEARGEYSQVGPAAFIAIANVVMNRFQEKKKYGSSLEEICLKPWQFSCWNKNDPNFPLLQDEYLNEDTLFRIAQNTARKVSYGLWPDLTRGSNHYHATHCQPSWIQAGKLRLRLGGHMFYRL